MLERFRSEAQFTAALGKHPNITRLLDAGTTDDGLPYLVMEYVQGRWIDKYCDQKRLDNMQRLKLFLVMCDAVKFAHQNTVIHRDLKPSNILVSDTGQVALIDFGIAKLINPLLGFQQGSSTRTFFRVLTPNYASPEQARGEPPTTATDVYSLGVVLYGLLTGRAPYEVDTTDSNEIARVIEQVAPVHPSLVIDHSADSDGDESSDKIAQFRRTTPAKLRRQLQGDLGNIVLMALRKEPERRYGTVAQFAADIRCYLEGLPVIARKDTFRYRAGKFIVRNKSSVTAAALLITSLLGGIAGTTTQWKRAEQLQKRAEHLAEEAGLQAQKSKDLAAQELDARILAQAAAKQANTEAKTAP